MLAVLVWILQSQIDAHKFLHTALIEVKLPLLSGTAWFPTSHHRQSAADMLAQYSMGKTLGLDILNTINTTLVTNIECEKQILTEPQKSQRRVSSGSHLRWSPDSVSWLALEILDACDVFRPLSLLYLCLPTRNIPRYGWQWLVTSLGHTSHTLILLSFHEM